MPLKAPEMTEAAKYSATPAGISAPRPYATRCIPTNPAPNAKNFPTEGMWLRRVKAMAKQATAFTKRAV